jgi:hypothetical protein
VCACLVVRVEMARRREALLGVLLSGLATAPVLAPPADAIAEETGTAESMLFSAVSMRTSVPVCLLVPTTAAMLISSVCSTDKCRRRDSVRTRMRPTSSALRFHKVKLPLLRRNQ